jgi:hypothetical protein
LDVHVQKLLSALGLLAVAACGDSDAPSPQEDAGSEVLDAGDDAGCHVELDASSGSLGPTSSVRVANTLSGLALDAWVADDSQRPVRVAQNLEPGTISDYFAVPIDAFTRSPEFVLLPAGACPANTNWSVVSGPDRAFISVNALEGESQRASVIIGLDDDTNQVQWETLDESELAVGSASQANLHISYGLFDIRGPNIALGTAAGGCFHNGSTNVNDVFSLPPGSFDFGVYDALSNTKCVPATLLASVPLDVPAGQNLLVVTYLEANMVKIMSAPILERP